MVSRKRAAVDDSSSDEEIDMDKMIEAKDELTKIRRDRETTRMEQYRNIDKALTELCKRIKETVDAHNQQRTDATKAKLDRLRVALTARDGIEQQIKEYLREVQRETKRLVAVLDRGYEYRLEKASRSLVTPESEQKTKAKRGAPSS